ncbi:unnamed protein product [Pedinophyceae sp. YPF-701]|nr:unnamed protein product [Pedinophyceae sp. YPF-701]
MARRAYVAALYLSVACLLCAALSGSVAGQACDDKQPGDYTCEQQKAWGKCGEAWLRDGGFCRLTCGACSSEEESCKSVMDLLRTDSDLSVIADLVSASGALGAKLSDASISSTLLAPTNDAVKEALDKAGVSVEDFEGSQALPLILSFHLLDYPKPFDWMVPNIELGTLLADRDGSPLRLKVSRDDEGRVTIVAGVTAVAEKLESAPPARSQCSQVLRINKLLLPPSP